MIINTDEDLCGIEVIHFSGGEPHVVLPEKFAGSPMAHVHIYAKVRSGEDLLDLMAICNALKNQGILSHLFLGYLPGARQDRLQGRGAITASVYASIFATQVASVTTLDVHSEAAGNIYSVRVPFKSLSPVPLMQEAFQGIHFDTIVCPDKGAKQRTYEAARGLGIDRIVSFSKERSPETGHIHIKPEFDPNMELGNVLVADDICDGGATFNMLAGFLNSTSNHLFVTHGIFSKGLKELQKHFATITTTDTWCYPELFPESGIRIIKALPYYLESLVPLVSPHTPITTKQEQKA